MIERAHFTKTIEYEWIDILEMKQEDIAEISKNMISITIG